MTALAKKPKKFLLATAIISAVIFAGLVAAVAFRASPEKEIPWKGCKVTAVCGDISYADCGEGVLATDMPTYFFLTSTQEEITCCGGCRMQSGDFTGCPPKEWTCR